MNYKNLIYILIFCIVFILPIIISLIFILKRSIHLIFISEVIDENISIKISIKIFFNLINITKTLYPIRKKEKKDVQLNYKKNKEDKKDYTKFDLKKIEIENLLILYKTIKKVKVTEIYSNLNYGSKNISITSFIYILVNIIYGNIINYLDSNKTYLKVTPCYTKNYIYYKGKLHISPTIKDIITIGREILKIYIKIKKYEKIKYSKEEDINEISKLHKKFNGYNS